MDWHSSSLRFAVDACSGPRFNILCLPWSSWAVCVMDILFVSWKHNYLCFEASTMHTQEALRRTCKAISCSRELYLLQP